MRAPKQDNITFDQKVMLRQTAVSLIQNPVIMETHGGYGDVYQALYHEIENGVVFEKDANRTTHLAHQRPSWAVYEADCVTTIGLGAGSHLCVNLLDIDPYGDPHPTIKAFFNSQRPFAQKMVMVVNDGLRHVVRGGKAWDVGTLQPVVQQWGNDLWNHYLEACEWLVREAAAVAGYEVTFFEGYYTGIELKMTHYLVKLEMP